MKLKSSKILVWLAVAAATTLTGCSTAIYKNAKYADLLKRGASRVEIQEKLGEPVKSGELDSNDPEAVRFLARRFDDFIVRGPVFDYGRYSGNALGTGMTFGLFEPIEIPRAVGWRFKNSRNQFVKVFYDETDHYFQHIVREYQREGGGEQGVGLKRVPR
jgi:hypothetical protein